MPKKKYKIDQAIGHIRFLEKCDLDEHSRGFIKSVLKFESSSGYITGRQLAYIHKLVYRQRQAKENKKMDKGIVYLYGISDGAHIKLGMSKNPSERLQTLQTSNPRKLALVWFTEVNADRVDAKRQEDKLHRYCRKHRVRGEWFKYDCLEMLKNFQVKH